MGGLITSEISQRRFEGGDYEQNPDGNDEAVHILLRDEDKAAEMGTVMIPSIIRFSFFSCMTPFVFSTLQNDDDDVHSINDPYVPNTPPTFLEIPLTNNAQDTIIVPDDTHFRRGL